MSDQMQKMREAVSLLNEAAKAYYQEDREIMSNLEYDKLYDELAKMEQETGVFLSASPTQWVGYELLSGLPKEEHGTPMLSLDKTKDADALKAWLGEKEGVLSWKLDGLTIALTYEGGRLTKAVTRGNGIVGEVITNNARVFVNLPLTIPEKGRLVVRGEAIIRYSDFEKINESIEDVEAKYKNPRNLCSGSVRQLNNRITAERNVHFFGFSMVAAESMEEQNSRFEQMKWLRNQGFDMVESELVNQDNLEEVLENFASRIQENDFPSDGLVLVFDDIGYGESLGATSKFPRDSIAFKWQDEEKETTLQEVLWSPSRTGLINPIAVFSPVELEGTTVTRASVHNLSILESLALGLGDQIQVYKANMIIPQIAENLTRSGNLPIPDDCPACGESTQIKEQNGVKSLYCTNDECPAKHVKSFAHFVSRDAMGIDGLSEATLEKLISKGLIRQLADLFHLTDHKEEIVTMEGFGKRSYENLIAAIEKARKTNSIRLLYSLGIPTIGLSNAKTISAEFSGDWGKMQEATEEELMQINGIGPIMAKSYVDFFAEEKHQAQVTALLAEVELEAAKPMAEGQTVFSGLQFVITGSTEIFKNREELKGAIEARGGKVTGSVTSKTSYLINNDTLSHSSKNKKAHELGVPILAEHQIAEWIESGVKPHNF